MLWVRAALITFLAFVAAAVTPVLSPLLPGEFLAKMKQETVRSILDILANSMLAVTTFSLTVMVTSHLSADRVASPRAHRILVQDGSTQTVLATFVGAFVYALVGIVMLQTSIIGEDTLAMLYVMTLFVFAIVIVSILRWIARLSTLGSVEATIRTVEERAGETLNTRQTTPFLGGVRMTSAVARPEDGQSVTAPRHGFVQHIDTSKLDGAMEDLGGEAYAEVLPGDWVAEGEVLATLSVEDLSDDQAQRVADAFTIGDTRTYAQDASFGISVLSEIAERALSPSVNDPKTALDVVARLSALFLDFAGETPADDPKAPRVHVRPLDTGMLVRDAFEPIARDGRAYAEVALHVQVALERLSRHRSPDIAEGARITSARALAYAENGLLLAADRARVREAAVADRSHTTTG